MSDTPKTDAMMTALLWRTGETLIADVEFADFARELERENAALREDSELLSWLLKRGVCWRDCDKELEGEYWTVGHDTEWLYDQVRGRERIRAAIDAARAKEAKP